MTTYVLQSGKFSVASKSYRYSAEGEPEKRGLLITIEFEITLDRPGMHFALVQAVRCTKMEGGKDIDYPFGKLDGKLITQERWRIDTSTACPGYGLVVTSGVTSQEKWLRAVSNDNPQAKGIDPERSKFEVGGGKAAYHGTLGFSGSKGVAAKKGWLGLFKGSPAIPAIPATPAEMKDCPQRSWANGEIFRHEFEVVAVCVVSSNPEDIGLMLGALQWKYLCDSEGNIHDEYSALDEPSNQWKAAARKWNFNKSMKIPGVGLER